MDENVAIYHRYIGCRAFQTRYQQTTVDKEQNQKIAINIDDISVMADISESIFKVGILL